jgi:hypothetical protein
LRVVSKHLSGLLLAVRNRHPGNVIVLHRRCFAPNARNAAPLVGTHAMVSTASPMEPVQAHSLPLCHGQLQAVPDSVDIHLPPRDGVEIAAGFHD